MNELPYVWRAKTGGKYCVLESLENVPEAHEIAYGKSRAVGFPADAQYRMSGEFKKQVALADNLWGPGGHRVVSAKLKTFVEARNPTGVEFLPVSIINHKGKADGGEYYLLHPVRIVDCVDQKHSVFVRNAIDSLLIASCSKLVLDLAAIPEDALLWRPKHLMYDVFVQRGLADDIAAEGFTGVRFKEIEEYGG